jgi:uncharacterized SAM-binding protein YcdF (DUF218 family)
MVILNLVAAVLSRPLCLALILAVAGLTLLHFSRRRAGAWLIAIGGLIAYLASTSMVGDALLTPLVGQYPVFEPARALGVRDIVVLGSSYTPHDHIPVTGALDPDGLARIVEGVRLARSRPGSRLLVSGGAPPGFAPSALGFAQMAADLGIERSAVVIMDRALDTSQEARDVAALLGHAPFILVTSAFHMPRAMRLMRRAGADPVPAPTGQSLYAPPATDRFGLVPGSRGLRKTEAALHEYLGLAAVSLRID